MRGHFWSFFAGGLMAAGLGAAAGAAPSASHAEFLAQPASPAAHAIADWVVGSGDNKGLPFVIVDKAAARVLVFQADGKLGGITPALLGQARGDDSVPGIGQRKLSTILPKERTTPAGRFIASLGSDLGVKDVVWVDYDAAISLHRVVTSNRKEHRLARLASPTIADNRISYGCINVPAKFFDAVVRPAFLHSSGIVYILPEVKPLAQVFPGYGRAASATQ